MTETLAPLDTASLPPDGTDPNQIPAAANPDALQSIADHELTDAPLAPEAGNGYVDQSREAFRDVQEQGKAALRRVGHAATKPFVRSRRDGSAETTGGDGTAEQTRMNWRERARGARSRAGQRLENRWENRQQEHEAARMVRRGERIMRLNEKRDQKRQEDLDRRADRIDDQIHKATMTRKEFRDYRYQKQARKDKARDEKMLQDWRDEVAAKQARKQGKQEAKQLRKDLRTAVHHYSKIDKVEKARTKRQTEHASEVTELQARATRLAELRDDPVAYADFLRKEKEAKDERRKARVQKAGKVGKQVLHGANVATKVVVGAGIIGGELAAKHAKDTIQEVNRDERVRYAKVRASVGFEAVRRTVASTLTAAGEKLMPTVEELEEIADTGELEVAPGTVVEIDLHPEATDGSAEGTRNE